MSNASLNCSFEDCVSRGKREIVEIFKVLWNIGCFEINVFFYVFNAQIIPVRLYKLIIVGVF